MCFEMNKKMDIIVNNMVSQELLRDLNTSLDDDIDHEDQDCFSKTKPKKDVSSEHMKRLSSSTSKSKLGNSVALSIKSESISSKNKLKKNPKVEKTHYDDHIKKFESMILRKVVIIQKYIRGHITRKYYKRLRQGASVPKLIKEFIQEEEVIQSELVIRVDSDEETKDRRNHLLLLEHVHC